jgi:hypothetical protein
MSNPQRMGSAETNAAEILHISRSRGDGNWKDHAMQCIPPKTIATQMGKEMTKHRSGTCRPRENKKCKR